MTNKKTIILGAGLAGVTLGERLTALDRDFTILEKEPAAGGLCRTNKAGAYYWDFGTHAMYSRDKAISGYYAGLPLDMQHLSRNVRIFHRGRDGNNRLLTYPFEIGVKDMPLREKLECLSGYLIKRMGPRKNDSNLEGWIHNSLGFGMARHFMTPYNNKIWNCPLSELSSALVSARIEPLSTYDFVLSAMGKKIIGRSHQASFVYPRLGVQQFINYTAKDLGNKLRLNANVIALNKIGSGWEITTADGTKHAADLVVSTIPLAELLKKVEIPGLDKNYEALKWNSTCFAMVGLKPGYDFGLIKDCHWVFFKGTEVFYRLTLMHNHSKYFPPALVAEITLKGGVAAKSTAEILDLVIKDLLRLQIIKTTACIGATDIKLLDYTYPIPALGTEEIRNTIRAKLRQHGILLLGRSGDWDYLNMDQVILKARNFAAQHFPAA